MKFFDSEVPDRPQPQEITAKLKKISPFEWANSIYLNDYFMTEDTEKNYEPFMVNKILGMGSDTVLQANEMNQRFGLDKRLQYDYLINKVRAKKRYNAWIKPEAVDAVEDVQTYYGYSKHKALQVMPLLSDADIDNIRKRIRKGGING